MTESHKKIALIATLPKSGTWYSHTFFWCYDELLKHSDEFLKGKFSPDLENALRNKMIKSETTHKETFGLDKLHICHTICPGFAELNNPYYQKWEALHFPVPGYNWGEPSLRHQNEWELLNPKNNPNAKIIYLYRNPLDHFVSFHRHVKNHIDEALRFKILHDGTRTPINNIHDYVFKFGGLSAFIKSFLSYREMQRCYPDQVMMVSYENLTQNPFTTFHEILKFIGIAPDSPLKLELFEKALSLCSKEALTKIESNLDSAIAGDQVGSERHIRGGEIGKWKNTFTQIEIEAIETALNLFDISLNDFTLSPNESTQSILPWISTTEPKNDKLEFFACQFDEIGSMLSSLKKQLDESKQKIESLEKIQSEHNNTENNTLKFTRRTMPLHAIHKIVNYLKAR